jgi:hypothetical protein
MWNESLEQNSLLTTFQLPSFRSITSGRSVSIAFIVTTSRQSSPLTDDGGTHQSDGYSGSDTDPGSPHPFHPTTGMLSLPKPSDAASEAAGQDDVHLEAIQVPYFEPPSRTPPDDRLMTKNDSEKTMAETMRELNRKTLQQSRRLRAVAEPKPHLSKALVSRRRHDLFQYDRIRMRSRAPLADYRYEVGPGRV